MNQPRVEFTSVVDSAEPHQPDHSIGRLLVRKGKIKSNDIEGILQHQREERIRFGEAVVRLGLVTEADIQQALAEQFQYAYVLRGQTNLSEDLFAAYEPFGARAEALRGIRSELLLRWFSTGRQFLSVVAGNRGNGCSRIAANIAVLLSQLGKRALLVDTNLRAPRQHQLFGLENRSGLSNLLAGRGNAREVIHPMEQLTNLHILTAGPVPPNPQELLARPSLVDLFEDFAERFAYIILDTAPSLANADSIAVISQTGGAIMVVKKDHTTLPEVQAVQSQVASAGAMMVGAVLYEH